MTDAVARSSFKVGLLRCSPEGSFSLHQILDAHLLPVLVAPLCLSESMVVRKELVVKTQKNRVHRKSLPFQKRFVVNSYQKEDDIKASKKMVFWHTYSPINSFFKTFSF